MIIGRCWDCRIVGELFMGLCAKCEALDLLPCANCPHVMGIHANAMWAPCEEPGCPCDGYR